MRKRFFILVTALLLTFAVAACSSEEEDKVIATVNGEEIMESRWMEDVNQQLDMYVQQGLDLESEQGQMFVEQIEQQALETLIRRTVIEQAALESGITVPEERIEQEIDRVRDQFDSHEVFEQALEDYGYTLQSYTEILSEELLLQLYLEESIGEVEATEEEIQAMYDDYKEQLEEAEEEVPDFEELAEDIEAQIIENKEKEKIQDHIELLLDEADIERHL